MTQKHTPGPLYVGHAQNEFDEKYYYVGPENRVIAQFFYSDDGNEALANAQLFSSAWQLLRACKEVNKAFTNGRFDKFGRLRLTKAQGEALWFEVSQAAFKSEVQS